MKKIVLFLLMGILGQVNVWAEEPALEKFNEVLVHRVELASQLQENLQEVLDESKLGPGSTKSVARSVLYSAVVPGLGQLYANSYVKAGLFAAAEVAAWAVNIHFDNLGDDKEAEYRQFGDQNWSEYRYWSYVNYLASQDPELQSQSYVYDSEPAPNGGMWHLIDPNVYGPNVVANLRSIENKFPGFTHTLPETKTQQYYEMIGKYPSQFGNAWADASFNEQYNGYTDDVTPMNDHYTNLSKDAENLYRKAGYGSMAALVNHLISAVDAGFTTRSYNRRQMRFSYDNRQFNGEYVNMFGVAFIW